MFFDSLRQSQSLKTLFKSNIYLMKLAHRLLEKFDIFLPIEQDYEIVSFLPRLESQIILDVGAHKGESVRSFRKFDFSPIFSIEANPGHEKDLEDLKRRIKDFDYKITLATNHNETAELFVPSYKGQELTVWSSIDETSARKILTDRSGLKKLDSHLEFKSIKSKAISLDELNLDPFLIKVDVEGQELKVLEGLTQTLTKHYPVLMIENNDRQAVTDLLETFSYQAYIYDARSKNFTPYTNQTNLNIIYLSQKSPVYQQLSLLIK